MILTLKTARLSLISLLVLPMVVAQATCKTTSITATADHLVDNANGTISDAKTGLMWKKCTESQTYNASTGGCDTSNSVYTYNWSATLNRAQLVNAGTAGEKLTFSGWRVPNINELTSIIEYQCHTPSIDTTVFTNMPTTKAAYWSSTPLIGGGSENNKAWFAEFGTGGTATTLKTSTRYIRLVRTE